MAGLDRRGFIAGAVGAAVGLTGVPSVLRGRDDRFVRLGIIGTGGRGRSLMGLALQRSDCTVKAICDIDPEAIERSQAMFRDGGVSQPAVYGSDEEDFLELLGAWGSSDPDYDIAPVGGDCL